MTKSRKTPTKRPDTLQSRSAASTARPSTNMTPVEVAEYAASICGEIARIAQAKQLDFLAYLLAMAQQEALEQSDVRPRPD